MTTPNVKELEFEASSCFIVYDAESGEILYIHECFNQIGAYETEADPEEDTVLELARAEYDNRSLKVMKLQDGLELSNDKTYVVDTYSGDLKEADSNNMHFRDFNKLNNE